MEEIGISSLAVLLTAPSISASERIIASAKDMLAKSADNENTKAPIAPTVRK